MSDPNTVVDLRSDTVTRPSPAMKEAMVSAPLGDDVFGDDPTVNALQARMAHELGKEAALFVASGTMANQLALRAHTVAGDDVIGHIGSHIYNYESGAAAALAGVTFRPVHSDDGSLPMDSVRALIHQTDDPHYAPTTLICMENTNNATGGCIVAEQNVQEVAKLATNRGIGLHLDGARLYNAAVGSNRSARDLAAPFDTVSVCFSKGLGAPVGSVLAGSKAHIAKAYRFRKMYGGSMRQAGVLAAAALYAIDHHVDALADDHRRARALAESLDAMDGLTVDLSRVHTNLIYFHIDATHPMARTTDDGTLMLTAALNERGVLIIGSPDRSRAVLHRDVNDAQLHQAISAFREVMTR